MKTFAAGGVLALAGCLGDDDDDETDDDASDGPDDEENGEDDIDDYDWRADDGFQEQGDFVLPADPEDSEFVDWTGEDEITIETHNRGGGLETQFVFDPPFVRVSEGTTVRFVNTDGVFHTVTSTNSLDSRSGGGDEFDEVITAEGDEFVWEADETGRQDYYCSPHAGHMWGSIEVV